jgi:hypothetical protein
VEKFLLELASEWNFEKGEAVMSTKHDETLHIRLINAACRNGWRQYGWKAAMRTYLCQAPWRAEAEDSLEVIQEMPCIPDAWRVRIEKEGEGPGWSYEVLVVELLEVEVTHPVDQNKFSYYERLWWAMDDSALLHLRVYRMDRYGFVLPLLTEHTAFAFIRGYPQEGRELYIEFPNQPIMAAIQ